MNDNGECDWFDRKYDGGRRPTLKDKTELFRQVFAEDGIKIPDRAKIGIEKRLQHALFELKNRYCESAHVIAHSLLFCCSPLLGLDERKYQEYVAEYERLMKKHEKACSFTSNYELSDVTE